MTFDICAVNNCYSRHFELVKFALVAFASLVAILVPMVSIDYFYYGKIVVVPVSIVIYKFVAAI